MRIPDDHEAGDEAELQAPPELVTALKQLSKKRPFVPPYVDDAVFRAAHRHLARPEKRWRAGFPLFPWLAAATVVIVRYRIRRDRRGD